MCFVLLRFGYLTTVLFLYYYVLLIKIFYLFYIIKLNEKRRIAISYLKLCSYTCIHTYVVIYQNKFLNILFMYNGTGEYTSRFNSTLI